MGTAAAAPDALLSAPQNSSKCLHISPTVLTSILSSVFYPARISSSLLSLHFELLPLVLAAVVFAFSLFQSSPLSCAMDFEEARLAPRTPALKRIAGSSPQPSPLPFFTTQQQRDITTKYQQPSISKQIPDNYFNKHQQWPVEKENLLAGSPAEERLVRMETRSSRVTLARPVFRLVLRFLLWSYMDIARFDWGGLRSLDRC